MFGSVIVVDFQSAFHSEKHVNNIILKKYIYFWDQHIKIIWKHQKYIHSKQKKKSNFMKSAFQTQSQIAPWSLLGDPVYTYKFKKIIILIWIIVLHDGLSRLLYLYYR